MPTVLIIGAGPAGATAAICLARLGWEVELVEQHRFPRDKVCGECLSPMGADVLARLGLGSLLPGAGAVSMTRAVLHGRDGSNISLSLPRPMLGISRQVLDSLLMEAARGSGVAIHQPQRCESIDTTSRPCAYIRNLRTNAVVSLTADVVILADGKGCLGQPRPRETGDFGVKAHFEDVEGPGDVVELFSLPGHYGGLAPIEDGRWNAAFSVPRARLGACGGDVERLMGQLLEESTALGQRLRGARRISPILVSPLPRFGIRSDWPEGIIPIGNAAAAIEPIGGEGMGLAMRSAELAAEWIDQRHRAGQPTLFADLAPRLARLWRRRAIACRAAALVASRPLLASAALQLLQSSAGATQFLLNAIAPPLPWPAIS